MPEELRNIPATSVSGSSILLSAHTEVAIEEFEDIEEFEEFENVIVGQGCLINSLVKLL